MIARLAQKITTSVRFQVFTIVMILLSGLLSGWESYFLRGDDSPIVHFLAAAQQVILWVFVVEIGLKIAACGARPWRYFLSAWNIFDFLIVASCLLPIGSQYGTVFRMARLVRTLRLVTLLPKLQLLVSTLLKSIPSLGYIGILLGLHFYMYAVLGTFVFGTNDPVRFGNLHRSFLTLFQVLTLEGWNDVLATQYLGSDIHYEEAWRTLSVGPRTSEGQPLVASLYFVTFIMLGTMIMLNLFTGVIINAMEEASNEVEEKKRQDRLEHDGAVGGPAELDRVRDQLRDALARLDAELSRREASPQ